LADKRDSKLKSIFLFQDAPALVVAQYGVNRNPSSAFVKGKETVQRSFADNGGNE